MSQRPPSANWRSGLRKGTPSFVLLRHLLRARLRKVKKASDGLRTGKQPRALRSRDERSLPARQVVRSPPCTTRCPILLSHDREIEVYEGRKSIQFPRICVNIEYHQEPPNTPPNAIKSVQRDPIIFLFASLCTDDYTGGRNAEGDGTDKGKT